MISVRSFSTFNPKIEKQKLQKSGNQPKLSHLDESGNAKMVDISSKKVTDRIAIAKAIVEFPTKVFGEIFLHKDANPLSKKGDIFGVARIAAIAGAKRTADLIPLCHHVALSHVDVRFYINKPKHCVHILTQVKCRHGTGVEMEALMACSLAALTIYDMCKALSDSIRIVDVHLFGKYGGRTPFGNLE